MPEDKAPGVWERLKLVLRVYRPVAWLVFLIASLVLFLAWMPSQMRHIIWQGLSNRGILSILLLVFSLLAVSLLWSAGQRMDAWVFLFFNLQGSRPVWLDRTMLVVTQIGSGVTALAIGLVLYLSGDRLAAYVFILGTLTLWIVVELVKALVRRSRPFIRVTQARIVGYPARGRSFPSGHTSQAFFIATLLSHRFQLGIGGTVALFTIAGLVGFTRMYVGAHYPRDVIGGAVLGSIWGVLATLVEPYWFGLRF